MTYSLKVIIFVCNRPYFSHYFRILCWKSLTSKQKFQFPWLTVWELWSLQATGLIFLVIFSFFVEKHKIQFPQLIVLELFVWFTGVELSPTAGIKQVYPLIKLHLGCPILKKDGHLRCGRGICHLFWWLFFAKCLRVDEDGTGWGHPYHLDTYLVFSFSE